MLDAAVAFGSGEHGSTRGCLRALERDGVAPAASHPRSRHRLRHPGDGGGVAAAPARAGDRHRPVVGARRRAPTPRATGSRRSLRVLRADGWQSRALRRAAPYDLVFANILARPLTRMAADLARHLAPGGAAILAGLLARQARWVLAAHRRHGLVLRAILREGDWATLVLQRPTKGDVTT